VVRLVVLELVHHLVVLHVCHGRVLLRCCDLLRHEQTRLLVNGMLNHLLLLLLLLLGEVVEPLLLVEVGLRDRVSIRPERCHGARDGGRAGAVALWARVRRQHRCLRRV
jgi:hypothetical protein